MAARPPPDPYPDPYPDLRESALDLPAGVDVTVPRVEIPSIDGPTVEGPAVAGTAARRSAAGGSAATDEPAAVRSDWVAFYCLVVAHAAALLFVLGSLLVAVRGRPVVGGKLVAVGAILRGYAAVRYRYPPRLRR